VIRINLLPHREMRRERRKKDFVGLAVLTAVAAAGLSFLVGVGINQQIATQGERNTFIEAENKKLDEQIKEIASLRQEIDALKARQQAVENLQSDRTLPVHLLDELVKQTPEGIFLKTIKQEDKRVLLTGYAQSNERVSELLRNLANVSPWTERPELIEIKSVQVGQVNSKDARTIFEFSLNTLVKGPAPVDPKAPVAPKKTADGTNPKNLVEATSQKVSAAAATAVAKKPTEAK
jgi:type IV pilus assembly protein PilN